MTPKARIPNRWEVGEYLPKQLPMRQIVRLGRGPVRPKKPPPGPPSRSLVNEAGHGQESLWLNIFCCWLAPKVLAGCSWVCFGWLQLC